MDITTQRLLREALSAFAGISKSYAAQVAEQQRHNKAMEKLELEKLAGFSTDTWGKW